MPKRTRQLGHAHSIREGFDLRLYGATRTKSQMSDPAESLRAGHTRDGESQGGVVTERGGRDQLRAALQSRPPGSPDNLSIAAAAIVPESGPLQSELLAFHALRPGAARVTVPVVGVAGVMRIKRVFLMVLLRDGESMIARVVRSLPRLTRLSSQSFCRTAVCVLVRGDVERNRPRG
jgi:hypothetical protein